MPTLPITFLILGALHIACGFRINNTTANPVSDITKAELVNISIDNLASEYLKIFNPDDLTFLKISNFKANAIEKSAFNGMNHLNYLEISDGKINSEIDPNTFSRLPGLEILVLRNIGLRKARLNLTHVQELILAQNDLEEIEDGSLSGPNINYIDISNNRLRSLSGSFKSYSKLSMIDVSKNKINHIGDDVFKDNANLIRILASENKLLSTTGFKLPWLKNLDLFSNKIPALDSESFSNMSSLEELVLAFNEIRQIKDSFKDLIELKFLNLAWNHIEELNPNLFRNNPYLSELSLQGNKLRTVHFNQIHYHLTQLDLSHNQLITISDDFFLSMPNLNFLDLSFNMLTTMGDLHNLPGLKVLNAAFNRLTLKGNEMSKNYQLSRVNLSGNRLEMGFSYFKNNRMLTCLDLSDNNISDFCDADFPLKNLLKVNLRSNRIKHLNCLRFKNFKSLCEIDLRDNPLSCGRDLDDLLISLSARKISPHGLTPGFKFGRQSDQCKNLSQEESVHLWNSLKNSICPYDQDLQSHTGTLKEREKEEIEQSKGYLEESLEEKPLESLESEKSSSRHNLPPILGIIDNGGLSTGPHNPQSEKLSWEQIDQNSEFIEGFEEQEIPHKKSDFSWYTITAVLIGLSLSLTCFNLAAFFLYFLLKVWGKNDSNGSQRYTFLKNEVYKNTTEPTKENQSGENKWFAENRPRNKFYGKLSKLLVHYGLDKSHKDTESVKNILIAPNPSNLETQSH